MKRFAFILFCFFITGIKAVSQPRVSDSLRGLLDKPLSDTGRIDLLLALARSYYFIRPESSNLYATDALRLAREAGFEKNEVEALNTSGEALRFLGNYPGALRAQFQALELHRKLKDKAGEAATLGFIGFVYVEFKEYRMGLSYLFEGVRLAREVKNKLMETFILSNIGNAYDELGLRDSALYYQQSAFQTYNGLTHGPLLSLVLTRLGNAYFGAGQKDSALLYYHLGLQNARTANDQVNNSKIERMIAELYASAAQYDSSMHYARQSFIHGNQSLQRLELLESGKLLAILFRRNNMPDSAYYYHDIAQAMSDSLYGPKKFKDLQLLLLEDQQRQQELQNEQERYKSRIKLVALAAAVGVFLVIASILYRNNRQKQRTNNILEKTLSDLKATQAQLIQSEKMASLGELTAGIAHEIQNPLNFVNNFSEVNKELIAEMNEEVKKGNYETVHSIAKDIAENEDKINFHGKRADAIVKGMLQHSRSSSGIKEPTDINALADEYLRLAYHGLRAKDKSFNATTQKSFDDRIGPINVIPQDIGRVILNLITNAFYAVTEKKKLNLAGYQPTVTVSTKAMDDRIAIIVKDNGTGIPSRSVEKIFQPFFTTKPTGQGTGLGLSLSYDIINAHGGELKVETMEGEGTEFIILLPK